MQEINLYQLFQYYAKKWIVIAVFTAIGLAGGLIYVFYLQTPLYKSDATLILIDPSKTASSAKDPTRINNYITLFKSRRVLQPVIDKLSLDKDYDELVKSVTATSDKDTEVIKVSVASEKADTSMLIADEAVASFKKESSLLYDTDNIQVVDKANRPDKPYNVHPLMQTAIATAAGLVTSLVSLFITYDYGRSKAAREKAGVKKVTTSKKTISTKRATTVAQKEQEAKLSPADVAGVVNALIGTEIKPKRKRQPARKTKSTTKRK
ncbi:MAG TPA: Wzz/FepE/Etk N-terminal domain-containing protein [Candidatus Saccharimonadales bacterium]|nr:Wzz/FepE/Etk N-terminal domain-containing protein [Candidatus Saccharimonadales bacterium]